MFKKIQLYINVVTCLCVFGLVFASTLITEYQFDGNLVDSEGNATLVELGTNTTSGFENNATGTYWFWTSTDDRGGGFQIDVPDYLLDNSYSLGRMDS